MIGMTLCSGIGAPEVAAPWVDWRFAAEIEDFPRAVLQERFGYKTPDDHNQGEPLLWGDMTEASPDLLRSRGLPLPDLLVAGTPCQAFSIAGARKGVADERGNLTLKFVEICHAIVDARPDGKLIVLWENVPGVLSDKENAFGCFLAGLVGADDALCIPEGGSWPGQGMVAGPRSRAAWRVLDAQYFGVAQRRRRVFVVVDFGNAIDPAKVLFEPEGLRGNTAPSRKARKETAENAECGTENGSSRWEGSECHPSLAQSSRKTGGIGASNQEIFSQRGAGIVPSGFRSSSFGGYDESDQGGTIKADGGDTGHGSETLVAWPAKLASTLNASFGDKLELEDQHINSGAPLFVSTVYESHGQDSRVKECKEVAPTVSAKYGTGGGNVPLVARRVAHGEYVDDDVAGALCQRDYKDATDLVTHTLRGEGFDASEDGTGRGTPLVPMAFSSIDDGGDLQRDMTPTLRVGGIGGQGMAVAFAQNQRDEVRIMDVAGALSSQPGMKQQTFIMEKSATAYSIMPMNSGKDYKARETDVAQPLMAGGPVGGNQGGDFILDTPMAVRRLMPVECVRLQGFPDDHLDIQFRNKPAGDGHKYKAVGNSMAVPNIAWITDRIREYSEL